MATMQDVADRAGVSLTTVSRVVNNPDAVSPDKRERVLAAIRELDFTPSYFARGLVTKKTGLIGVIVPDISYAYYSLMLSGIEDYASNKGYKIVICNIEEKLGKEMWYLQFFAEMRVDGIVLMHERSDPGIEEFLLGCGIPIVMASVRPKAFAGKFPSVNIDDFKAAYEAVELLIKKSRRRVALLAGNLADATSGEARFEGYKAALKDYGLAYDESLVRFGSFSIEEGHAHAAEIFARASPRPDAVFAAGDTIAVGVLRYLQEMGLRVPGDVALVGFDDLPFATICTPRLSTVRQPIREIGIAAVRLLISEIAERPAQVREVILKYELVERESS
jgi:LacI family transcriptional regulator